MIEVEGLRKEYGELVAVDGISFTAQPGQIFGLLGPNGAGKSTTINCISGLLRPTSGRIRVSGHDVVREGTQARASLGVVPQELALYEDLSAMENVLYWGAASGLRGSELRDRGESALQVTGLLDRAKDPPKKYSGGMKRRLNLACGIVHGPRVLLLDEPTVGVDPQSRVRLLELVREQADAGVCVIYTTHYMEEAESMCDQLGIIDHGKLVALGTLEQLRALLGERDLLRMTGSFPESAHERMHEIAGAEVVVADEGLLTLAMSDAPRMLPEVLSRLTAAGAEIRETTMTQPSLETLFIKLTGKELRE